MGPLVPDIISNEFNFVIAFLVGIGFGFALEQAGFSSTKKLVGLFYGYDFTVLRVFFTAGVTALIGVLLLAHLDLLDLSLIYINPTFLWSAIIGGIIMGAGFIIGGFCPGTSVCAAAVGKIDAMAFIVGSIIGIFLFTEGYPLFANLYMAENMGAVRMDQYFSISPELFAFFLTAIAIFAFVAVTFIEKKVNKEEFKITSNGVLKYALLGILPFVVIGGIAFTPDGQQRLDEKIAEAERKKECHFKQIPADKLAYELVNNHFEMNLIDVRPAEEFKKYHLPLAINIPLSEIKNREWKSFFTQTYKKNVFYADKDTTAKRACLIAKFIGKSENYILSETTNEFKSMFFEMGPLPANASKKDHVTFGFRTKAAADLMNLENALKKFSEPVKKQVRKVQGGCS